MLIRQDASMLMNANNSKVFRAVKLSTSLQDHVPVWAPDSGVGGLDSGRTTSAVLVYGSDLKNENHKPSSIIALIKHSNTVKIQ